MRSLLQSGEGVQFTRTHHVVRKTTLYDMDVEPSWKYTAIGCQDRNIRWAFPSQTFLQIHFYFVYFVGRGCAHATVSMWGQDDFQEWFFFSQYMGPGDQT